MKLKAPKTWQLILILVSVIVLAIGGSFLAVYLKTGFKPEVTPPESIEINDVDGVYNLSTTQYEAVKQFRLKITTPTENVTQNEITLSFASGVSVTTTEDGKISDGIIIVPQKVKMNEEFYVQLVQEAYLDSNSNEHILNKGGISHLIVTTQNNTLTSSQIQVAVDKPVGEIKLEAYNSTTGDKLTADGTNKISQGTNFVLKPTFYPEASQYMFSDDKNDAATTKRQKDIYYESASSNEGITLNYNDGDIYFVAGNETSAGNIINAYTFASAEDQAEFYANNSELAGLPLYTEAIRVLSTAEKAIKTQIKVDVVEANVGSFSIKPTAGSPFEFTVNKLFRISAGSSALAEKEISIRIRDIHDNDLSSMIKNVGLRIISIKDTNTGLDIVNDLSNFVTVKGGAIKIYDEKEYVLINSNVKNLNHAYWEISTNGEYEIVAEIKLFVQDENGDTHIFDDATERKVYMQSKENVESDIYWETGIVESGISMTIVYDKNGNVLSSEYKDDLRTISHVPSTNVYTKRVFFAYYDAAFPDGKDMGDYVAVTDDGAGMYTISSGETKKLYPLLNSYQLVAKEAIDFNLVFATVRTDAYGNPIMNASGTYTLEKISSKVLVSVKKTLQGFKSVVIDSIDEKYFVENRGYYAIPTGVENAFELKLTLKEASDAAIFENEKSKISFYASKDIAGKDRVGSDVFEFGEMTLAGGVVTIPVKTKADVNIAEKLGTKFFVRVEYNNSVAILDWTAQPADGDKQAGVVVYNQRPDGISNDSLENQTFNVTQTMTNTGSSEITIRGGKIAEPGYIGENAINQFAELINGENYTIITDVYGRAFKYDYTISSSNSKIVITDNNEKKITFGTGTENGIIVTITAGSQSFNFTLNVSTTGVTGIKVDGKDQDNLANPKYALDGKVEKDASGNYKEIVLKNTAGEGARNGLLDVFVSSGLYDPSYYTIKLKDEASEALREMIEFTTGETTTEIKSFIIKENFADDVTISFVATNSDSTLNFTFDITIKKFATEEKVDFANIKYGEYEDKVTGKTISQIGVADEDKGENFDPTATYVYSAFPIDLNEYVKVRLGEADAEGNVTYVNWAEIYKEKQDLEINSTVVGKIENGKLTFNDVYEPTQYTFTLYVLNGNKYAYYKDLTFVVCPNFKLVQKNKDLSVKNIKLDNDFTKYFELKRITLGYGTVQANGVGEITGISSYEVSKYYQLDTNKKFVSVLPLDLGYGETYKTITISAKTIINETEKVVATCSANLSLGFSIVDLASFSDLFMLGRTIRYNGYDAVWVDRNSATFVKDYKDTDSGIGVKLNPVKNAYTIAATLITFTSASNNALVAGNSVYFQVYFTDGDNTLATWRIPFVWSRVGSKIASYPYETPSDSNTNNTDLNDTLNNPNNLFVEVEGGKTYYLVAPFEYYLQEGILTIVESIGDDDGDGKDDGDITYTQGETGETFEFKGITFTIDDSNQIKAAGVNNGNTISVGQTFTITKDEVPTTYYFKAIDTASKKITIYKAYEGTKNKSGCRINYKGKAYKEHIGEGEEPYTYTYKDSIYGQMLTSLGNNEYLTGLQATDFETNKTSVEFGTLKGQKVYSINGNILTINDIISDTDVETYFEITQKNTNGAIEGLIYRFMLKVKPNATNNNFNFENDNFKIIKNNVTYPFGGNAENLTVENNEKEPIKIDLKAELGADTQNQGKHRIEDVIQRYGETKPTDISKNAELSVSQLLIDGTDYTSSHENNTRFTVAISIETDENQKQTKLNVTFTNKANAKNVTVKLLREYPSVYGADFEYVFSINASSVEYFIKYNNAKPTVGNTEQGKPVGEFTVGTRDATWKLANTTDAQTVNVTTKQRTDSGESNVDPNKVVTVLTHDDLGEGYTVEYDYKAANPTLSIKLPAFRASEITRKVYFSVDGKVISTITLIIPATVNATQKNKTLPAGGTYGIDALVELKTENAELDTIETKGGDIDYVNLATDGKSISIFNAIEDKTITLQLNYKYTYTVTTTNTAGEEITSQKEETGFVIYTYEIAANIKPKQSLETQSIISGTEYTGITFDSLQQQNPAVSYSEDFKLTWSAQDSGLFGTSAITMGDDGQIKITATYVAITTSTTVTLTFTYKNGEKELFTFNVSVPVTIYPAVKLQTNYPNPSQTENLTYESVMSNTEYANFLSSAAEFASAERIKAAAANVDGSNGEYKGSYNNAYSKLTNNASVKIIDIQNMEKVEYGEQTTTDPPVTYYALYANPNSTENSGLTVNSEPTVNPTTAIFKFTKGNETGVSYVILQVKYHGVSINYTVYVFDNVVSGYVNSTIHRNGEVETIYQDRIDTTDLFNKSRLLKLEVGASAIVGAVYYPYIVTVGNDETYTNAEQLLQFQLKSEYVGRTIYVDSGKQNINLGANKTIVFFAKAGADVTKDAVMTGVTFVRTAGRVEYRYATADGQSIDITNADMKTAATTASPDAGNTYIVGYYIGEKPTEAKDFKSQISYQVEMGLDIDVDRKFDASNASSTPTVIEIEAHKGEYYRLVEQAGIRHPSTGELITAKSLGDSTISYEVVDVKEEKNKQYARTFDGYKTFKYRNTKGEDYLKLHDIAEDVGGKKIYDYYLFGLGCAADGDYVLLKIIYTNNGVEKPFFIAIKIVPDYEITLAGEKYEPVVENNSAYVTNKDKPYVFTPVKTTTTTTEGPTPTYKEMTLAASGSGEQLISAIRTNWNATNIAYSFDYVLTLQENSEYNTQANLTKLRLTEAKETINNVEKPYWTNNGNQYKPNIPTKKFAPAEVVFGVKQYFVEITDDYGYKIMFYFNLVPADDQTPTVYEAVSTLNFTEGDDFDIGLVYDAISINETKDDKNNVTISAEIEYNKAPESDAIRKIILQNIDAWGLTTNYPDATFAGVSGMSDKYKAPPKFHDVTVTGVTFKYANDKGTSAKSYDGPEATYTFRLGSGQDAVSHLYDDVNKCFIPEDEKESPVSITYKKITYTSSNGGVLHATITGELTETTAPYKWKAKINGVDREFDVVNAGTSEAPVYKLMVNGEEYADDGEIKTDIEETINGVTKTINVIKYKVQISVDNNSKKPSITLKGDFTPDSQGNYYLGLDTSEKETSVVTSSGTKNLATDALYWPGENSDTNKNYRTLSAGYYKVPYMDGWIYGTSDTTQVSILISLTYKAGVSGQAESCVVVYNANITKKAKFNSTAKVITDGVPFTLKYTKTDDATSGYIQVAEGSYNGNGDNLIYDDTLAVTIPAQGQVVLSINISENDTWKNFVLTRNNTSTTSQRTDFISLSEVYGKTINPENPGGMKIEVSWVGTDGANVYYSSGNINVGTEENSTYTYGSKEVNSPEGIISVDGKNYEYKLLKLQDGTETKYKLAMIKEDNVWRMVDNYKGSKIVLNNKIYEVGFEGNVKLTLKAENATTVISSTTEITPGQELQIEGIPQDVLYIESAERIPSQTSVTDVYQYSITKSYIIKANGTYYQYKHNFIMTPKYAYFDNGLGQEVVKEIYKASWDQDTTNGYTVTLEDWANGATLSNGKTYHPVQVAPAATNVSTVTQGNLYALTDTANVDLSAIEFTIGKDGTSYTDAVIYNTEPGKTKGTIVTGANYKLNNNQYILIRIWIKASGGPNGNFDGGKYGNKDYKKLLGELRIYLTDSTKTPNP